MNVHTRHARMIYRDAQESWNRECHSDALREMQLVPEIQPLTGYRPHWSLYVMAGVMAALLVSL